MNPKRLHAALCTKPSEQTASSTRVLFSLGQVEVSLVHKALQHATVLSSRTGLPKEYPGLASGVAHNCLVHSW